MMRGGLRVGRREKGRYKGREERGGRKEAGRKREQGDIYSKLASDIRYEKSICITYDYK